MGTTLQIKLVVEVQLTKKRACKITPHVLLTGNRVACGPVWQGPDIARPKDGQTHNL